VSAPTPRPGRLDGLVEFLSFRRALGRAARISEPDRDAVARARALTRQRADAADTLWSSGLCAEGLRLMRGALSASVEATLALAGAEARAASGGPSSPVQDAAGWPESLVPLGFSAQERAVLAHLVEEAERAVLPRFDGDVSAAHADLYRRLDGAQKTLERALGTAGRTRRDLRLTLALRVGGAMVAAASALAVHHVATRVPEGVHASASAVWANAPAFGAETVLDGRDDTYWLLPDGTTGWVEATLQPPRRIAHVQVRNASNPPHGDRATHDYSIELYSGGQQVRVIEGSLPYTTTPEVVQHDVGLDGIERIRFVARSAYRTGAGLAELHWD